MRPAPSPNVWSPPANGGCYDVCDFKDATSRLVVRGVSRAPEILSACSVRPDLAAAIVPSSVLDTTIRVIALGELVVIPASAVVPCGIVYPHELVDTRRRGE